MTCSVCGSRGWLEAAPVQGAALWDQRVVIPCFVCYPKLIGVLT